MEQRTHPTPAPPEGEQRPGRGGNGRAPTPIEREEIRRIEIDDEDRLAFRVGVNLITLAVIGFGVWRLILFLRP